MPWSNIPRLSSSRVPLPVEEVPSALPLRRHVVPLVNMSFHRQPNVVAPRSSAAPSNRVPLPLDEVPSAVPLPRNVVPWRSSVVPLHSSADPPFGSVPPLFDRMPATLTEQVTGKELEHSQLQKKRRPAAPPSLTGYYRNRTCNVPLPTSIFLRNRASPSSKVSTPLRASTIPVQSSSPPSDMVRPLPRKQHPVFKTTPSPNSRHRPRPSPISRPPATYLPLDRSRSPPKRPYIPALRSASSSRA